MKQTLQLKTDMRCPLMITPFPAGVDLKWVREGEAIFVRHPDDPDVLQAVKLDNIKKVEIRSCTIKDVLEKLKLL